MRWYPPHTLNGPLLRAPVLWLTERSFFRHLATRSWLGRRVAGRFVAGESLDDAMRVASGLNRDGIASMLDHLGENVRTREQASAAADQYVLAVKRLREAEEIDGVISVKLTQLGLDLSYEVCLGNAERVLVAAGEAGMLVMIDMEAHPYVDDTLRAHRELRERFPRVGVCLQSYLHRTGHDVFELPDASIVRLVKGSYLEPASVAYPRSVDVDRSFARLFATLIARGHSVHVATHSPSLVSGARSFVERRGVDWRRIEFQMLYGIRRELQLALARDGYPVRVYIPYGSEWYPYLTRRLAERPANLWFFAQNLIRMGGR
jgi:proline dehydrogenase